MAKVYIFVADGGEEVETLTPYDLLVRAGNEVKLVSVTGSKEVHGAHGINFLADQLMEEDAFDDGDLFMIPGGMPGTTNLGNCSALTALLSAKFQAGKHIAAICAAPMVLGGLGILKGKKAICYPGCEGPLEGAEIVNVPAITDGNVTTGRGPGAAFDFGLELVRVLNGQEKMEEVKAGAVYPYSM